ncbi:MAG TPA: ABC transporter permease [Candidatus Limnocylindrales bacterium]|nr:ABC transporter permease [Candidatus Limnocylindrales bacterium]
MNLVEAIRLAFSGLMGNRLRSGLTMLGILIGVGAVILLVAVGNGASASVQSSIQGLGSNLITVSPSNLRVGGVQQGFGTGNTLTMQDVTALKDKTVAPDVVTAIPNVNGRAQVTYGNQNWNTSLSGTTEQFPQVRNYQLAEGQFFSAADVQAQRKVAVLGPTVVQNLFGGQDPLGQTLKINRQIFRVVGVFQSKGSSGFTNQDDLVAMPITTAWAFLLGGHNVQAIYVEAASSQATQSAESEVTQVLLNQHHISTVANADFQLQSQADVLTTASQVTGTLTLLLGAIAAISLVVGGIGIMNIMLVTVTERTREIGIRKAIGARRRDVLLQFLIESMFLSAVGGALGILVGTLGSSLLGRLVSSLHPLVSVSSIVLAFGVSLGIGLFFGIYPANRAARLHPIEALRYE